MCSFADTPLMSGAGVGKNCLVSTVYKLPICQKQNLKKIDYKISVSYLDKTKKDRISSPVYSSTGKVLPLLSQIFFTLFSYFNLKQLSLDFI